jgi:hypothetical protein
MRILSLPYDQILKEVKNLNDEVKEIKHSILKLCWYMRGSITMEDAYYLTKEDQEIISNIVKENLETTKSSGLPFF